MPDAAAADSETSLLDALADLAGIEASYVDVDGAAHATRADTKRALLLAMGFGVSDARALRASLDAERARPWRALVSPATVTRWEQPAAIVLHVPEAFAPPADGGADAWLAGRLTIRLRSESGALRAIEIAGARAGDTRTIDGAPRTRVELALPALDVGEYDVEARWSGARPESAAGALFVAPPFAFLPEGMAPAEGAAARRAFGFQVNLYALRRRDDWGIGTLADAATLAAWSARELGADLLGLPPLHATANRAPFDHSPYAPISRLFRNAVYLDVESALEIVASPAAQAVLHDPSFRSVLLRLRRAERVDYAGVLAAKRLALRAAHFDFVTRDVAARSDRARAFDRYCEREGDALQRFATFEALREHFSTAEPPIGDWRAWPPELRDPESADVAAFRESHAAEIDFERFVQWLLDEQVEAAHRAALDAGATIGLYHDLAIGGTPSGAEAWSEPAAFVRDAEVGAPPDAFQRLGQKWGTSPLDPRRLREAGFAPFVRLLRASMRHGGALRLDHVMGLFRLWWVPRDRPATEGAYVRYPADELLGIVALESWRQRCIVVGEDLGTVPPGVRESLARERALSYRLAIFERDAEGGFVPPRAYPALALAAFTTHDLPTLAGFWSGRDVEVRTRLRLFRNPVEAVNAPKEREREKEKLLAALGAEGLRPPDPVTLDALIPAVHAWLARTPCALVVANLDDALGVEEQRNLPGTTREYPNWSGRLPIDLDAVLADPRVRAVGAAMRAERDATPSSRKAREPAPTPDS